MSFEVVLDEDDYYVYDKVGRLVYHAVAGGANGYTGWKIYDVGKTLVAQIKFVDWVYQFKHKIKYNRLAEIDNGLVFYCNYKLFIKLPITFRFDFWGLDKSYYIKTIGKFGTLYENNKAVAEISAESLWNNQRSHIDFSDELRPEIMFSMYLLTCPEPFHDYSSS